MIKRQRLRDALQTVSQLLSSLGRLGRHGQYSVQHLELEDCGRFGLKSLFNMLQTVDKGPNNA